LGVTVRAVKIAEDGVHVVDVDPDVNPGERVSVATSGICGSDLHLVGFGPSPITLGHEFCGRLDDGTPVAVLPTVACGTCEPCRRGEDQQCPAALGATYGISRDGGLADEARVDPACLKVLPPTLPLADACLVEPLAVAAHGIRRSGIAGGARVLVVGAGAIGLCAVVAARSQGADVDVLARHRSRTEAAERLGAGTSPGHDYDAVIDAAGTQSSFDASLERVRTGGTVAIVSTFWEPITLGMGFQVKEVTLVPAFMYGHHHGRSEFESAAELLDRTPDLPATVITHRFPLDEAPEAFRVAADHGAGAIKVVIHP
jgi:threonine dehydrogenase-like Zn-dependent dehydrogenase